MAYQRKCYRNRKPRGGTPGQATFTGRSHPKRYAAAPSERKKPFDNYLRKMPV